jgi:hypothetical protein
MFWKVVAAIDGRIDRAGEKGTADRAEGRTRRRKKVRGMVGAVVWLEMQAINKKLELRTSTRVGG